MIDPRAVEAAARAEEDSQYPGAWDALSATGQKQRIARLTPVLEAAAPYIIAQALREQANKLDPQ